MTLFRRAALALLLLLSVTAVAQGQTYTVMPYARIQFFDNNGDPCNGCLVNFYTAGTSSRLDTYSNSTGTLNANPVVLDAYGRAPIFLSANSYKIVLTDSSGGTTYWEQDNVAAVHAGITGVSSTGDITFQVDTDNNGSNNVFSFTNGTAVQKAKIDENGDLQIDDDLTIGDATEADKDLIFDGNAFDFYVCLDDSADDLVIGVGNACGTTPALSITDGLAASFAGTLSVTGATTLSSTLTATASSPVTHTFASSGGNGALQLTVRNNTAGTASQTQFLVGTDALQAQISLNAFSSTFTTSGPNVVSGGKLGANGSGGLSIAAEHASGAIRFYTGGTTERASISNDGTFTLSSSQTHVIAGNFAFVDNATLRRNTSDGSDSGYISINGGGAAEDRARGAYMAITGNESGNPGHIIQQIGNVANAEYELFRSDGTIAHRVSGADGSWVSTSSNGTNAWKLTTSHASGGYLRIDYSAGGNWFDIGSELSIKGSGSANQSMFRISSGTLLLDTGGIAPYTDSANNNGATTNAWLHTISNTMWLKDGIAAPGGLAGWAKIYVDTADGDLKVVFGDGTVRVIVAD